MQISEKDMQRLATLLSNGSIETGIKIKPSMNWLPILIQLVTLVAAMGWAYGQIDGRLKLIEYRLSQIEKKVDGSTTAINWDDVLRHSGIGP